MLYARNSIFEAVECRLDFEKDGRFVRLTFLDRTTQIIVRATEADMAALTGRFIKERLFGLH